jgi:hypothetical protein
LIDEKDDDSSVDCHLIGTWCGLSAPDTDSDGVEVPFIFEHNEILVQVKIAQDGSFAMMLDTDTDPSSINSSFAQSNNFRLREIRGEITGGDLERRRVYLTKLERVELGLLPARDLQAVAIDLSKIQNRLGIQVQGVLDNFLAGRVLQIDYPARVLRFYRSSATLPIAKGGQAVFPFRLGEDGDIVMEGVTINGKSARATIDTGSDGTFALTPAAIQALGLTDAARDGHPDTSEGYKGTLQNTRGALTVSALARLT